MAWSVFSLALEGSWVLRDIDAVHVKHHAQIQYG